MSFEQEEKKPKKDKVIPKPKKEQSTAVPTKIETKKTKKKESASEKKAEEIAEKAEKLFSPEIKKAMGKYWEKYKFEIGYVLQEYNLTIEQLAKYINGKKEVLDAMTDGAIKIAKENNEQLYSPREEVYTIIVSAYISGYIHGIDPPLLVAIADRETRFTINKRSSTADVGPFQVNLYSSAVTEMLGGTPESRRLQTRNVKKSIEIFGGFEFNGVVRKIEIEKVEDKKGKLRDKVGEESVPVLQQRPLYNAIWAARTLCIKCRYDDVKIRSKEDMQFEGSLRKLLGKYNGGGENSDYAKMVPQYYMDVYLGFENQRRIEEILRGIPK